MTRPKLANHWVAAIRPTGTMRSFEPFPNTRAKQAVGVSD